MERIHTGGPAFPRPIGNNGATHYEDREANSEEEGMTLLDYFAGQYLVGLATMSRLSNGAAQADAAEEAYDVATRFIQARNAIIGFAFILLSLPAQAQSSATYTARLDGIVNCRQLAVSVTEHQQNGGTTSTVAYAVRECPSGSSTPTTVVVQGFVNIPSSAYTHTKQAHALNVTTPHGAIIVTWRQSQERQNTFSGTWTERQNGSFTQRTQEEQAFSTATVEGSVVGYPTLNRPGWISEIAQITR